MREKYLICANPDCKKQFSTKNPHQRFHNTACGIVFHKKKLLKPRPLKSKIPRQLNDPLKRKSDVQLSELELQCKQDIHDHLTKIVYFKSKLSGLQDQHRVKTDSQYYYVNKIETHTRQLDKVRTIHTKVMNSIKIRSELQERIKQCLKN